MAFSNTAKDSIQRLKDGNVRFVKGIEVGQNAKFRAGLASGQSPFAIVLCCSDSRAPAEIVFDQGLGDLFVVRVAGNVVAPSLVGSIEFATVTFGTPLIVVMGHSNCGAVLATIEAIQKPSTPYSENIRDIVDRIQPGIENLVQPHIAPTQIIAKAVRANIRTSCSHLRHGSRLLEDLTATGKLTIVGAELSLETGLVKFLD